MLDYLTELKTALVKRASSWDREGGNRDFILIAPGESAVLAEIGGPGKITHIWITQDNPDPDFLRKVTLHFFWDEEEFPSVLAPVGDFFCLGHSIVNSFQSLPFTASARVNNVFGGFAALNCYLPMPFRKRARLEIQNETEYEHRLYYYIDYELYDAVFSAETAYFHACFRRENPTAGWAHHITANTPPSEVKNLSDKDNYLLLDAAGEGHFIGFNLSVTNLHRLYKNPHERYWWGEGDEMFFIDGEAWPPSLHGTGSEDAFNQAYGMQRNAYLRSGSSIYENDSNGYQTAYVFYIENPVRFRKSLRASIEHGHGNHLSNDYASVAYWYQLEPHKPFAILPPAQRAPLVATFEFPEGSRTEQAPIEITDEMKNNLAEWDARYRTRQEPGRY